MTRLEQFNSCLNGSWVTSGLDVQWRFSDGVLAFQCTRSETDWMFNFLAARIDLDGDTVHAGFAALWESVRPFVELAVGNAEGFTINGYSQGAALATLAHRYFTKRGSHPVSTVFGSPKVFASKVEMPDLVNIQVKGDIVTIAPPFPWFKHVGSIYHFGKTTLIPLPSRHTPDSYRKNL